jgi:TonB-dependent starch-binding outer membrane protein SusC
MNAFLRQTVRAFLVAAFVCGAFTSSAFAQATGNVRGRVTEAATGRPIASVQVFIPGTSKGTLTGGNGEFSITGVNVGDVNITAQIIGHNTQQKRVNVTSGGTAVVDFAMVQSTVALDELVITGTPGATTKRALGNSVSKIDAENLVDKAPVKNIEQLLLARTPGLTLMPGAGTAGAAGNINIRGSGSLNAGNKPTFYVDGIKIQNDLGGDYSVLGQSRSPLDAINPDDIESIEVIKGPAAATLYGADAASGVIQIITKKGKIGQQSLQWNAKVSHGSVGWFLDQPVNWKECTAAMIGSATWPGCAGLDPNAPREQRIIQDSPLQRNGECAAWVTAADCAAVPATQAIRDGMTEGYSLSVRGGGERFSFYASGDQDFERGVFFNNHSHRKSGRANIQFTPFDKLEATFNAGYSRNNVRLPLNDNASNGLLRNAYRGEPGRAAAWEAGYLNLGPREINTVDNVTDDERFIMSSTANFKPYEWFINRLTIGVEKTDRLAFDFTAKDTTGRAPFGATAATGTIGRNRAENHQWSVDYAGTVNFDVTEAWNSSSSVGLQYNVRKYHAINGTGEGLVANTLNLIGAAAVTRAGESRVEQNSAGFYVQEQVGLRNRLFLTGALRFDDNSAFGSDFSWATYPKLSASWVVSEEPFFKYGSFIDELKLRGAWGKAGNAPAPFSADRNLTTSTATLIDGTSGNAIITNAYGNPNLHAESGTEFELGFDAGLLKNRAGLEVTYYNQHTKDALISVPVPPSSGFNGNVLQNVGEIANSGLELSLYGTPIATHSVVWEVSGTVATNKNKLIDLGGRPPIIFGAFVAVQRHVEGYPLAGYWAYDVVRDAAGNPVIDPVTGRAAQSTDTSFIGPSQPTREIGLTNTLTLFGNLRLYAFVDYKGGHYLWSAREWWRSFNQNISQWVNDPAIAPEDRAAFATGSTKLFIDNADFIKLREVSATYTLPRTWAEKFRARGMSFTVSGRNLGMWTKYDLGEDPELNFSGDATFTRTDYMSVPMMRYYTATVNLSF